MFDMHKVKIAVGNQIKSSARAKVIVFALISTSENVWYRHREKSFHIKKG